MVEVFKNAGHIDLWARAGEGEVVQWEDFFRNYQSGVDWPVAKYWRELMEVYPDAKIILTVRDPERWYESCVQTIFEFTLKGTKFPTTVLLYLMPSMHRFRKRR